MWKISKQSGNEAEEQDLQVWAESWSGITGENYLSDRMKSTLKANLMAQVSAGQEDLSVRELDRVEAQVKLVTAVKFLGDHQKNLLFQSLTERIRHQARSWMSVLWFFRNWQAGIASVLVFVLVLGLFVVAPVELRITRAAKWTFLEDVRGEVYVNRDGKVMAVDKDFSLQEGDLIFTGKDGFVAIRFLDDSITRLSEDTSLEIKKLYVRPDDAVQTQVELSLIGGQVWASVYNLVDSESSFMIETENARADVNSRAAFAIDSLQDSTTLTVFDNVVDLSKKNTKVAFVQPVIAGFTAEISSSPFNVSTDDHGIAVEKNTNQNDQWILNNQALDKQHQEKLKEENNDFISSAVASDETLGALADFRDGTKALFANTEIEKARQRFLDVHLGFIKSQELLNEASANNQYRRQATPLLIQYKMAIKEIVESFPALQQADSEQADRLLLKMKEEVGLQKKALSLVIPGEKLYLAKETVMEASSYFAVDSTEKADYMLDRARNKLLEMQNLIAKNNLQDAEASFRSYLASLDDLVKEVEDSQVAEIEGSLFALLNEQIKQFKLLTAIEVELKGKGDQRLSGLVNRVKMDSLEKLINIVKYYRKNGVPFAMVMELKNTTEEFFDNSAEKTQRLADLEMILTDYPEYAQLQKMEEVSTENIDQASDIIVDFQSSQDLGNCQSECGQK
jgi:hypothetical protein